MAKQNDSFNRPSAVYQTCHFYKNKRRIARQPNGCGDGPFYFFQLRTHNRLWQNTDCSSPIYDDCTSTFVTSQVTVNFDPQSRSKSLWQRLETNMSEVRDPWMFHFVSANFVNSISYSAARKPDFCLIKMQCIYFKVIMQLWAVLTAN